MNSIVLSFIVSIVEVIKVVGVSIGIVCAIWHASSLKICERPLSDHDKKALAKPLRIGLITGLVVTASLAIRSMDRGQSLSQFVLSIGIYKLLIVPFFWVFTYLYPSKRGREMRRRAKLRKASLKK